MFEYTKLNSEGISCGTMKLLPENDFFVIYWIVNSNFRTISWNNNLNFREYLNIFTLVRRSLAVLADMIWIENRTEEFLKHAMQQIKWIIPTCSQENLDYTAFTT
jgi:hypothetical protein